MRDNIERIESLIEGSYIESGGKPFPSWIEISPTDFCTRRCIFCPKGVDTVAPNQGHLFMHDSLIRKISADLSRDDFQGTVILAGYGEPLASPIIMSAVKDLSTVCRVEMVTNGDLLTAEKLLELIDSGLSFISVSLYEGPAKKNKFNKMFEGIPESFYILRDRGPGPNFNMKLTNRAGIVGGPSQPEINKGAQCFYPHYSMMIDWNGDVLLCPQDWHRRIKFGNLAFNSVRDVWTSQAYRKYRTALFNGNRSLFPCSGCNCDGTVHGKTHAKKWKIAYDKDS